MKKMLVLVLALSMMLGLLACGSTAGGNAAPGEETTPAGDFKAGFGMVDITPDTDIPLGSYDDGRMSTGFYTFLEARAVAVQDAEGNLLIFAVGDMSWCPEILATQIREKLTRELGVPGENVILSGTHTHNSAEWKAITNPDIVKFREKYVAGMTKAALDAVADLKPAKAYVGSAYTENLNFVRRYIMDDGSLIADNFPGTGTTIVGHEKEPDNELQLLKFVREGGKDILIAQYQGHPHLEGRTTLISAQCVGTFREAAEAAMDIHVLAWNGAAGNLNTKSRIKEEMRTEDPREWGRLLWSYAAEIYDELTPVETGAVQVASVTIKAQVNHDYDHLVPYAEMVRTYYYDHNGNIDATTAYGMQWGIHSHQHAGRIIDNGKKGEYEEIYLLAWSFGQVAGVVLPYEMYDVSGMQVKDGSPFEKTFIVGYSAPAYLGYVPDQSAFAVGGYEVDNCTYIAGTAEQMVASYLELLEGMYN